MFLFLIPVVVVVVLLLLLLVPQESDHFHKSPSALAPPADNSSGAVNPVGANVVRVKVRVWVRVRVGVKVRSGL